MPAFDPGSFGPAFDLATDSSVASRGFNYASIPRRDHTTEAYNRLWQQFKDKQNIKDLLAVFSGRYDGLETAFYSLLTERTIYTAIGVQLDQIGTLVGQPRQGLDDDTYRRYILARVAANKSDGLVEDFVDVMTLVLNDPSLRAQVLTPGVASAIARVLGGRVQWETAKIIMELLRLATVAGVRTTLEFETFPSVVLTKTGGTANWDAGASSVETFAGNGYVETTVMDVTNSRMIGLNATDTSASFTDIDYAVNLRFDGKMDIHENGVQVGFLVGSYVVGDVIRVERAGTTVTFKKNGAVFYTSLTPSSGSLRVDLSFFSVSAATTLSNIKLFDAGFRKIITWQNITNVAIVPPVTAPYSARGRYADSRIYEAASGYHPQTAAETKTAAGGFGTWAVGWLFDDLSGTLLAKYGSPNLAFSFAQPNCAPKYACPGIRGLSDKAIEFISAGSNAFDGGNVYALSGTDDLAIIWTGIHTATTGSTRQLLTKGSGTLGNGGLWSILFDNGGNVIARVQESNPQTQYNSTCALPIGKPYVGMFVLERATNKLRIAVRSLDGTVANQGTEVSVAAAAPFASANSVMLGANLGLDAIERAKFSSMYVAHGTGAATGMSANAATVLLSFANKLNSWPYALPSYGQGYENVADKYPQSVSGLREMLLTAVNGVVGDIGNQAGITIYLLNETSGNIVPSVGSPTLTASGSPLYGIIGPRSGRDKAIGFSTTTDVFSGGTGDFDVNGSADIMIMWVGRITSAPANADVFGKGNAGAARWYLWHGTGGFAFNVNDGVDNLEPVTSSLALGEWHVGIAALERATNQARIGIRTLAGVSSISSAADASAIGSLSNAVAVKFGKSIGNADTFANYAALAITTGTDVARGVVANMSAILTRVTTQINRYYGESLSAGME